MINYKALTALPVEIQNVWGANLQSATSQTAKGFFRLVAIRPTLPKSFQEQRIIVSVVDENGFPLPNINVAFSYSTANNYSVTPDFLWTPPSPRKAFIVPTQGSGQIEQIQGDVVKQGQSGGITVYILEPQYASDIVSGCGMLADHTGLHLIFQLQRNGIKSIDQRLNELENMAGDSGELARQLSVLREQVMFLMAKQQ